MKQFYYQGKSNSPQSLILSKDLFIIRTKDSILPKIIFDKAGFEDLVSLIEEIDYYPEASVWVYRVITENPEEKRKEIKQKVRKLAAEDIKFIGNLMQREDNNYYQIYTGNLFLKFKEGVAENEKKKFFVEYSLVEKMQMGFDKNSYFLCPSEDDRSKEVFEKCLEYLEDDRVELCHPELVVKRKSFKKSDTYHDTHVDTNWAHEMIELEKAWETTKGANVKVCVIDDGIDHNHQAFNDPDKIVSAKDMFDDENAFASHKFNVEIHGTACASIACSSDDKALGVAPEAQLIIVRSKGLGSVYESEAIVWAAKQGAHIISCSWGPSDGELFDEEDDNRPPHPIPDHTRLAIEYATKYGREGKGCLIFFAAGNGNEPVNLDGYASNPNVMAIGAVNKDYKSSTYSDYGYPLFCCFPSSEILIDKNNKIVRTQYGLLAADRLGKEGYTDTDYFYSFGGTSAACPGMAGVAALMLSIAPELTIEQAKEILSKSCILPVDIDESYNAYYGNGIINAPLVVQKSKESITHKQIEMSTNKKTYALHIGIDRIDQDIYQFKYGDLNGCVNDARNYIKLTKEIATSQVILFNEKATRKNFEASLKSLAEKSKSGDTVIITYAGHGGTVKDTNGDEEDNQDETLVLYDGPWIDDETYEIWPQFKEGVQIIWISDSCHSGSNARAIIVDASKPKTNITDNDPLSPKKMRGLRSIWVQNAFDNRKDEILPKLATLKHRGEGIDNIPIKAAIVTFAACQDNQVAWEDKGQGMFTSKFISAWNEQNDLTYEKLFDAIKSKMPSHQNPNQKTYGEGDSLLTKKVWSSNSPPSPDQKPPDPIKKEENNEPDTSKTQLYALDNLVITTKGNRIEMNTPDNQRSSSQKNYHNVSSGEISRGLSNAPKAWDRAYNTLNKISNLGEDDFIEPDIVSLINADPYEEDGQRGDSRFLETYPNPEELELQNPFIWHLGKDFSQLQDANKIACPEIGYDGSKPAEEYPLIAHIDTGVLLDHPSLPKHWDSVLSRDHRNPEDKDYWYKQNGVVEQQGHGQGTIAILAGNIIDPSESDGQFGGYFGAFPYARVMSLRISDSVVILRAKKFAEAVDYAIKVGADVITMSMAGAPSKRMLDAVNRAYEAGVVVVSAGGNSWSRGIQQALPDTLMYPARFKRVIAATGATATHQPYLNRFNKQKARAAGGKYMQTCYGPQEKMKYAMAAYTPNLAWGDSLTNPKYFGRKGGGTSSATPQIAAAAALWIHKHRNEIDKEIKNKNEKWKKAELTRQALFRSAHIDKDENNFEKYFGNGILKAKDALEIKPKDIISKWGLTKIEPDSIGRTGIDDLIKMWFRGARGGNALDSYEKKLNEMVAMEIEQLMVSSPSLADFAYDEGISDGLCKALLSLNETSDFLKHILENNDNPERSRGNGPNSLIGINSLNFDGDDSTNNYRLISENIPYEIEMHSSDKNQEFEASFEITLDSRSHRSKAKTDLKLVLPHQSGDAILVKTQYEDESVSYEWKIPEWNQEMNKRSSNDTSTFVRPGEVIIQLNPHQGLQEDDQQNRASGGFLPKIKKFFVKIFRTVKGDSISGMDGLIFTDINNIDWKEVTKSNLPTKIKDKKHLLLLHGTFSSTEVSFEDLLGDPLFVKKINKDYGGIVFGYEMSTITSGIEENADELNDELKTYKLKKEDFSIIGHSRGCLVGRVAFTGSNKMILSAGTNLGTPLASKEHIVSLLNRTTTILGYAHPSLKIIGKVAAFLAKRIWNLPGIMDQSTDSRIVEELKRLPLPEKHLLIGSSFEPRQNLGEKIFDPALDFTIFKGQDNDGVTLTSSALITNVQSLNRLLINDAEISHFEYFSNKKVSSEVIKFI